MSRKIQYRPFPFFSGQASPPGWCPGGLGFWPRSWKRRSLVKLVKQESRPAGVKRLDGLSHLYAFPATAVPRAAQDHR